MVSKKTQTTEAKTAEVKDEAKAKVVTEKKKVAPKTVAKKTATKKVATPKVVEKKVAEPKIVESSVLQKENVDNMATVLAVKAENENKKTAKKAKKVAKAPVSKVEVKTEKVEELGKKATPVRAKRETVKENAQKAQAKKFVEQKNEAVKCHCCCKGKELFASWARAYKNMFKYKARTSRYENWAFMLINSIVSSVLFFIAIYSLTPAMIANNMTVGKAFYAGFILLFLIAQLFVYTSLITRRLHDAGFSAWRGFFKPLIISTVAMFVLTGLSDRYINLNISVADKNYLLAMVSNIVLSVTNAVAILAWVYYSLKTLFVSFFYEEDKADTTYGVAMYCDGCYKAMGIKYMVLYFIYSSIAYSLLNFCIAMVTSAFKI